MLTQTATDLEKLLDDIEKQGIPSTENLQRISETLARIFRLRTDEIGILEILPPGKLLRFVIPTKLQAVGTIPLNSSSALAARTARLRRPDVINNSSSRQCVRGRALGQQPDESIQKILSAPIVRDTTASSGWCSYVARASRRWMSAQISRPRIWLK